jgi:hypothetical protein
MPMLAALGVVPGAHLAAASTSNPGAQRLGLRREIDAVALAMPEIPRGRRRDSERSRLGSTAM